MAISSELSDGIIGHRFQFLPKKMAENFWKKILKIDVEIENFPKN
jgi:hypothetical protein